MGIPNGMDYPEPHSQTRNIQRGPTEDHGSSRKLKIAQFPLSTEYFLGIQRYNFGLPYQAPLHGQTGSPRKLTEAKNTPIPLAAEYFLGIQRYNFGLPYPTPLHGQTGSPRKLTEAKNSPIRPRVRKSHGNSALELWVAVPDPLTWPDRKPAEALGSSRKLKMA